MGNPLSKRTENAKENSAPTTPVLKAKFGHIQLDPRSPSANIARTPIQALNNVDLNKSITVECISTPSTKKDLYICEDPRSPTTEYVRTPIVTANLKEISKVETMKLHNKNLDNVRKMIIHGANFEKNNSPKLLGSSPVKQKVVDDRRKSFAGLLETNIDYIETDLDKVIAQNRSSQTNLNATTPLKQLKEQFLNSSVPTSTITIACLENVDPRSPTTDFLRTPIQITKKIGEIELNNSQRMSESDCETTELQFVNDKNVICDGNVQKDGNKTIGNELGLCTNDIKLENCEKKMDIQLNLLAESKIQQNLIGEANKQQNLIEQSNIQQNLIAQFNIQQNYIEELNIQQSFNEDEEDKENIDPVIQEKLNKIHENLKLKVNPENFAEEVYEKVAKKEGKEKKIVESHIPTRKSFKRNDFVEENNKLVAKPKEKLQEVNKNEAKLKETVQEFNKNELKLKEKILESNQNEPKLAQLNRNEPKIKEIKKNASKYTENLQEINKDETGLREMNKHKVTTKIDKKNVNPTKNLVNQKDFIEEQHKLQETEDDEFVENHIKIENTTSTDKNSTDTHIHFENLAIKQEITKENVREHETIQVKTEFVKKTVDSHIHSDNFVYKEETNIEEIVKIAKTNVECVASSSTDDPLLLVQKIIDSVEHENKHKEKVNMHKNIKEFDKKLTSLIYKDADTVLSPKSKKVKDGNRTPLGQRCENKAISKLRVSDKPTKNPNSKIPVFKEKLIKGKLEPCENTPPRNMNLNKSKWDTDCSLII